MSRRILALLSAAAIALAIAGCTAEPSADASRSPSGSASSSRSAAPSASPSGTPSPSASASGDASAAPSDPGDSGDLGDGAEDPVAPELPPTEPGPAVGADGTVQGYQYSAVAAVCGPQVQAVSSEGVVSADPTQSWRIDAASVATEWTIATPDDTLTVVCVITGAFDAPEFVYVTLEGI